ncbi:hypothetical protein HJC23_010568 [Cyclotella cryptica]|uniref:Uncharacterized protein n=1 Tax=Cyclotella cryptica TaxID=29204 RepID=A0ABD3NYW5_9STRA
MEGNIMLAELYLNKEEDAVFIPSPIHRLLYHMHQFQVNNDDRENAKQRRGYQFGDITKSLIGGHVEKLTGKPYQFGDLSRTIDFSIKESINSLTGKDDYQFGDLAKYVDSQIKSQVKSFTKKERYEFGDLTRELVRRVGEGEYTLDDLFMLLKALAIFEASISPVAGFLPVKLLVDLLNFSLANDVIGRVSSALAMELDRRLKKSILGDENYVLGDATRRTIVSAVKAFTGKESYSFGDVTRTVVSTIKTNQLSAANTSTRNKERLLLGSVDGEMEQSVIQALDTWDKILSEKDEFKTSRARLEHYVSLIEKSSGP